MHTRLAAALNRAETWTRLAEQLPADFAVGRVQKADSERAGDTILIGAYQLLRESRGVTTRVADVLVLLAQTPELVRQCHTRFVKTAQQVIEEGNARLVRMTYDEPGCLSVWHDKTTKRWLQVRGCSLDHPDDPLIKSFDTSKYHSLYGVELPDEYWSELFDRVDKGGESSVEEK